jgi:molecular chaperone DnaK (HSP70)
LGFWAPLADRLSRHPGTTYSCVATYEGTNVEIIANEQGSFTTPSFVSFTDEERLIGEAAKNQAAMNPVNTVFDVKYALLSILSATQQPADCFDLQASYRSPLR